MTLMDLACTAKSKAGAVQACGDCTASCCVLLHAQAAVPALAVQAAVPLAACYICRLTTVPGRFLPQKAKELGVAPGPLFGKLKAGIAVQGKERMVQPDEVTPPPPSPSAPPQPSPSLISHNAHGPSDFRV